MVPTLRPLTASRDHAATVSAPGQPVRGSGAAIDFAVHRLAAAQLLYAVGEAQMAFAIAAQGKGRDRHC